MNRVIVIGGNGQLGTDLVARMSLEKERYEVISLSHDDLEICNYEETRQMLSEIGPDVVINTAAFHQVDECEDRIEKAFEVNTYAVRELSLICRDLDAVLVHISTDYVFGGDPLRDMPLTEVDLPFPINVYGSSKLAGEYFVRSTLSKHLIIRSSGLYGLSGSSGKGGNFIETMLRLAAEAKPIRVVDDQRLSPTFTLNLAEKVIELMDVNQYGLYHVTNSGNCSWYEFAREIFHQTNQTPDLSPTTTDAFGAKANRPRYSVLGSNRISEAGVEPLRPWKEALNLYLT